MKDSAKKALSITIGKNVQLLRKKAGLSQQQLASAVGLVRVSIVNIEKGRQMCPVYTIIEMQQIFKCGFDMLLPKIDGTNKGMDKLIKQNEDILAKKKQIEMLRKDIQKIKTAKAQASPGCRYGQVPC